MHNLDFIPYDIHTQEEHSCQLRNTEETAYLAEVKEVTFPKRKEMEAFLHGLSYSDMFDDTFVVGTPFFRDGGWVTRLTTDLDAWESDFDIYGDDAWIKFTTTDGLHV